MARHLHTSYAHNLTVGVMTDPTDVTTFTEVAQAIPSVYGEWEPFEFDFTSYNGNGRYIAIMSPNGAYSYPYLDDLSVDRLSPCPRVRNITASAITGNSATISWAATSASDYGAVVDLTHNNRLNLSNNWGNVTGTFNLTTPGAYKWVFFWHNDGSVGTTPPAAVDNVQLAHNTCPSPTNVTAS